MTESAADIVQARPWVIRTDIPSIDGMFRITEHTVDDVRGGIGLPDLATSTSIAVVGPQGTGKSVLAMHIAARYLADCHAAFGDKKLAMPRVCYISTDMTYPVAKPMVRRFGLDRPNLRSVPFGDDDTPRGPAGRLTPQWLRLHRADAHVFEPDFCIELRKCPADEPVDLARYLLLGESPADHAESPPAAPASPPADPAEQTDIAYVDLASRTAGDDWAFVHRLMGVLSDPPESAPRHLVVIDAIEGLETFGGDIDAFGEASGRRARVAKLLRQATGKCHLVLIVEEAISDKALPEEFVSDVVFRLRNMDEHGYLRRTLQIEKARGQSTVRGRHPYVIRNGRGSTTGGSPNYDDPRVTSRLHDNELQSYVELFPSLHYASRTLMLHTQAEEARGDVRARDDPRAERAAFGIEYLDELLPLQGATHHRDSKDSQGLPCSTITALIGDAGTQKTGLGIAFLRQAFRPMVDRLLDDWAHQRLPFSADKDKCRAQIRAYDQFAGVPVLITTHDESAQDLAKYFLRGLVKPRKNEPRLPLPPALWEALEVHIAERTICRRLEVHDMPSAVLFNIIKRTLEAATRIAIGSDPDPLADLMASTSEMEAKRKSESWRVRVVIDDLSTIMDTYAEVRDDLLFLPFLLYHLRREELTSLIIDTRAGRPWDVAEQGFHTDLRALSDNRIYTWPVTGFFGDHRVAIAAIPPVLRGQRARVREVKRLPPGEGGGKGELVVDPVFELYAGLEENKPQLVPLEVRLYGETRACRKYTTYLNLIFARTFKPDPHRREESGAVVMSDGPEAYDLIRDTSYLKADMWLDHTRIVQIDEFWRQSRAGGRHEQQYLAENMAREQPDAQLNIRDPFHTYREWELIGDNRACTKGSFFDIPACTVDDTEEPPDRVPYLWDFGFLACRAEAWQQASENNPEVKEVWDALLGDVGVVRAGTGLTWCRFLKAATAAAKIAAKVSGKRVAAFDLAAPAGESFSCLILEIWLSEILLTLDSLNPAGATSLRRQLGRRRWKLAPSEKPLGLRDLLADGARQDLTGEPEGDFPGWSLELYKTWMMLVEAMDLESLRHAGSRTGFAAEGEPHATPLVVRHWYKTASDVPADARQAMGAIRYARLPGSFVTRGDWFLAVAAESRSYLLASRALDLLCSTRGNRVRLEKGVGLPTRRLVDREKGDYASFRSRLTEERPDELPPRKILTYQDVRELGSQNLLTPDGRENDGLGWLLRSGLGNYHRHQFTWMSWLRRMAREWVDLKSAKLRDASNTWKDGFDVYGELRPGTQSTSITDLETYRSFPRAVRALQSELLLVDCSEPESEHLPLETGSPPD